MTLLRAQQDRLEELYDLLEEKGKEVEELRQKGLKMMQSNIERIIEGSTYTEEEQKEHRMNYFLVAREFVELDKERKELEATVSYEYKVWQREVDETLTMLGTLVAPRKIEERQKVLVADQIYEVWEAHQDKGVLYVVALGTAQKAKWKGDK